MGSWNVVNNAGQRSVLPAYSEGIAWRRVDASTTPEEADGEGCGRWTSDDSLEGGLDDLAPGLGGSLSVASENTSAAGDPTADNLVALLRAHATGRIDVRRI